MFRQAEAMENLNRDVGPDRGAVPADLGRGAPRELGPAGRGAADGAGRGGGHRGAGAGKTAAPGSRVAPADLRRFSAERVADPGDGVLRAQPERAGRVGLRGGAGRGQRGSARRRRRGRSCAARRSTTGPRASSSSGSARGRRRPSCWPRRPASRRATRPAGQVALPGRPLPGHGRRARHRPQEVRPHRAGSARAQLRRRRPHPGGGAAHRRRGERQGGRAAGRSARPLSDRRHAGRGPLAAGAGRHPRGALARGPPLAGREPAPGPARGGLVRRGARLLLEGAGLHQAAGRQAQALANYDSAIRKYPLSVYALLSLRADADRSSRRSGRRCSRSCGAPRPGAPPPAPGTSRRGRPTASRSSGGRWSWRAWAWAATRAGSCRASGSTRRPPGTRPATSPPADDEQQDVYLVTAMLLDRGRIWSAAHAIPRYSLIGLPHRLSPRAGSRPCGGWPTPAPSPSWSGRPAASARCPSRCSWRSCARRARSTPGSSRWPTRSG